jgi:hypothetical protein
MTSESRIRILRQVGLVAVGAVYIAAGALKVPDPKAFAVAVVEYHLMPEGLVPMMAVTLPWWEILAGGMAIAGAWRRGALALLAGLSAVFLVVGTVTLLRGLAPPCGCFGIGSNKVGPATIVMEASLLVLTGALLVAELRLKTNHGGTESAEAAAGGGTAKATQV